MKIFIFIVEAQPTFTKGKGSANEWKSKIKICFLILFSRVQPTFTKDKGSANIYFNWLTITAIYTQQMPP